MLIGQKKKYNLNNFSGCTIDIIRELDKIDHAILSQACYFLISVNEREFDTNKYIP